MQSVLSKGSLLLLLYIETSDERERGGGLGTEDGTQGLAHTKKVS